MDKYNPENVHKRVDYVQYIYKNTALYPNNFENFTYPIAVYNRDGIIAGANKFFRKLAGITMDDIRRKKANIFDCLNDKNTGLLEAAHEVFDSREKIYRDFDHVLHTRSAIADYQIADYPNAIFFPMSFDRDGVRLGGILLDNEEPEEKKVSSPHKVFKPLTIAAACAAVAVIGVGAMITTNQLDYIGFNDEQVPLTAPLLLDNNAKPYVGSDNVILYPSIESATIPADTTDVKLLLLNPEGNAYNFTYEIVLAGTKETLYTSGLVEPGMCIDGVTLSKGLACGEYKALIQINGYEPDDFKAKTGAVIDFTLFVY